MIYGSICSGIEAATVAWHPLGWKPAFFSEIDKFPRAILACHYPEVPNLGDFTTIRPDQHEPIDLLVGGTPCQDFSIAGLRGGLAGDRGNLSLEFGRLLARERPRWFVWENVPGVFSSHGGRDFASILGLLSGQLVSIPADGWRTAGIIPGYRNAYGLAWRVLDAQFVRVDRFGRAVPQRRRRVFVVGYLGDWRRAATVLFEPESLLWNSAPRRQAWERVAPTISARTEGGGGLGSDFDFDGGLVARCVTAREGQRLDYETETLVAHSLRAQAQAQASLRADSETYVAHALRADGFDASEDGTGRGTPIVPIDLRNASTGNGVSGTIERAQSKGNRGQGVMIGFDCKASGRNGFGIVNNGATSPTLRSMSHSNSHQNAGGQVAIAFDTTQITSKTNRSIPQPGDPCHTLAKGAAAPTIAFQPRIARNGRGYSEEVALALNGADAGATSDVRPCIAIQERAVCENPNAGPDGIGIRDDGAAFTLEARSVPQAVATTWAVRRLMPEESESLQGFPCGYTNIPWRGKNGAPDGPRYKALGNSMAVNVMAWIGWRIEMVEKAHIT